MQKAGVNREHIILLLEDHHLIHPAFLEMINSLLSVGEVPGLYSQEELEPILTPLKDLLSEEGYRGTPLSYYSSRVRHYLHIVLILDSSSSEFVAQCEANPALYTSCLFLSLEEWSRGTMLQLAGEYLHSHHTLGSKVMLKQEVLQENQQLSKCFYDIHESCLSKGSTPRKFMNFLNTYQSVYAKKKEGLLKQQQHLQAGVTKLNEATMLVDELKAKAATQRNLLAQKQREADEALQQITASMQSASEQKSEMELIKQQQAEERAKLEKRKRAIDIELSEIGPVVAEAKKAVGNIKAETLSEIRALRMPPKVIMDILEGVLCLMGIQDTSWSNIRSFLARTGVKEEIQTFDTHNINEKIREAVEELLRKNKDSFEASAAKRASAAAAPLAAWVKANVRFSVVLEKIGPLKKEQASLQANLDKSR